MSCNKSTPEHSLEIMLDILSLDIFIKNIAAKSDLRLKESAEVLRFYLERDGQLDLVLETDYLLPKSNFKYFYN